MASYEEGIPLTLRRRDYILNMLARQMAGGTWIRISAYELRDFGGKAFFEGCEVTYVHDNTWFTLRYKNGHEIEDENRGTRVHLPWKIQTRDPQGWRPEYHPRSTNEGKTQMEHHVDRQKLIETITANKDAHALLRGRAQELYRAEIEKKTEEHVQGRLAQNEIKVVDTAGPISLPPDQSKGFDDQLAVAELDTRDVMVLNDEEFDAYIHAQWSGLEALAKLVKRLEDLT
jgi:hypothetical protein